MKKPTQKQIAERAGVSITTVHRVLNGKGGCSAEQEEKICRIAQELGYSVNVAAASLRKQTIQIAMIFPFRDNGGRFGLDQILDGYLDYRREAGDYNVVFQEFLLRSGEEKLESYLDMEYPELEIVLNQIYSEQPMRFDGVIIYGMSVTRRAEALLNRIVGKGTQVVVMERLLPTMEDACTVKGDSVMAGNLAAEILCNQIRRPGTVAVISQIIPGGDMIAHSCVKAIREERKDLNCVQLPFVMNIDQGREIAEDLRKIPDLVGVYATCGRHTASLLDALKELPDMDLPVIGSELFAETYEALRDRTLAAVIDKRPQKIGFTAARMLLYALGKNKPYSGSYLVPPRIIIRANSDLYLSIRRQYQHESESYSD